MLLDSLREFVRANLLPHLQGRWTPDCETQILWPNDRRRIPTDGNAKRGEPYFDDNGYHPPVSDITALGTTGWNYVDSRTMFVVFDIDGMNHVAGNAPSTLEELVARLSLVPEVEIITSKSGKGLHLILYFDPDARPVAKTRKQHIAVAKRALRWLANQIGDLTAETDAIGVVAWLYHKDQQPDGFCIIKKSTANMPADWELSALPTSPDFSLPTEPERDCPLLPQHQKHIDWLKERGMGEWDGKRLTTHTHNLLQLAQDPALKIQGHYTTISPGKDGPQDRNCFAYPAENGSWRVYRFGKAAEHESWWKSANGYTTTWFNRGKAAKVDPVMSLVSLAADDELFHDATGRPFVTTSIHGIKETILVDDGRYAAKLRLAYTGQTGAVAKREHVKTAADQLSALALLERPEYPVAIRVAEHGGKLYIDLADRERRIVEVSDGWRIVDSCPVRFVRPYGMLPLPRPIPGGKLADLRKFVNVEPADIPLLLAFIVGCFHPRGPYALLQLVGEQGSAKSSLMRWIHDFVDPNLAVGNTLPKDERDMLVAAQLRWLVSYDNVDGLSRKLSSLLCMLVTGAASANRKLFSDADQSILKAKRPIIITAIGNVVTADDLLDRTLTLVLPPIPPEKRQSEFAIEAELRRDGVRGRILGYILDGVSAALKDHAKVDRELPRLADFFAWATAAESGLGLKTGRAIDAFERQANEEAAQIVDTPFGEKIMALCKEGWKGSAKELADKVRLGMSAIEVSNELRSIAPNLRRNGFVIKRGRGNGKRFIELSTKVKATV